MPLSWENIQSNAIRFSERWKDAHNEEAQAQSFTSDFLKVFGVEDPEKIGDFEYKVSLDDGHNGYIDYFWKKHIAIEMKTKHKDLNKAYAQLKEYVVHLPETEMPSLMMVSDFENIVLYTRTTSKKTSFKTSELRKHVTKFAAIAGYENTREHEEQIEVNVQAAEKLAALHDALKEFGYEGHELELYLVRILFCLFADDTGIFPKDSFFNYVENSREDGSDLNMRLGLLFDVLNKAPSVRAKQETLLQKQGLFQFPYVNGGLFAQTLSFPVFNDKMRKVLLECCNFNWNKISPAIFGAMFQGVMDKNARRELGAHYTSEENILKLINSLFMDDLRAEFERVKSNAGQLDRFHKKISEMKFLDPACGCGNFLIVTYQHLRLLELDTLRMKQKSGQLLLDISELLKVNVGQFYGIEIEDFPCQIAQVGMWLMDHQMNMRVADAFGQYYVRLPLKRSAIIANENALHKDWGKILPEGETFDYILGNPPFVGARIMNEDQKQDVLTTFASAKNAGNLDYVCCWYKKAVDLMEQNKDTRTALVSTNSISQGEQVALLWKPFFERGIRIDFGYRTFKWSNEAKGKAAVHCVIVGFSFSGKKAKFIHDGDDKQEAKNINGYLVSAENVCIESRSKPLCDVPEIGIGNKPIDGGHYLFTETEKDEFLLKEPLAEKYFRVWLGSEEFINGKKRYCLWLGDCPPAELKMMPECMKRVEAVRQVRLASKSAPTRKLAEKPRRFHVENMPTSEYIVVPEVSSERRVYIPIGFLPPEVLSSNLVKIIPNATLYHFGVLTSSVHNAWMRAVGGRLKSDYRYSKDLVYNNFPWPQKVEEKQQEKLKELAQKVLDARAMYPSSSLADLYDPLTMPAELLKAHKDLDNAVLKLYGLSSKKSEAEIVAVLFEKYQELVGK